MKKFRVLFMLVLLSGFFMSAGGAYASPFLNQDLDPVRFWVVDDNTDAQYDDQKVTLTGTGDAFAIFTNSGFSIEYSVNGGTDWHAADLLNGLTILTGADDWKLVYFKLVDISGDVSARGSLHFYAPEGDLWNSVDITWLDGGGQVIQALTIVSANNDDNIGNVPIPPSALLLGSGVIGLIGFGVRRRRAGIS